MPHRRVHLAIVNNLVKRPQIARLIGYVELRRSCDAA